MLRQLIPAVVALVMPVPVAAGASAGPTRTIEFRRAVVNLEAFAGTLVRSLPTGAVRSVDLGGDAWYGEIPRRLPGEAAGSSKRAVPFVVIYDGPNVARARADANLNGDLTDDADAAVSRFPGARPGRSFLVDLGGPARPGRLVRVVVDTLEGGERRYRTQEVYGMLGSIELDGAPRLALLYDANHDGRYTKGQGDGVFVDPDGDRHVPIDVMAPEFGPFATAFTLGQDTVVVEELDPAGSRLVLKTIGRALATPEVDVGEVVPDGVFVDTAQRPVLLSARRGAPLVIYFWASWCAPCRADAAGLQGLYERYAPAGLEILGVSYDFDRESMQRYRRELHQTWPTSFTGGIPAEDPMGRSFREAGTGIYYVIDATGRLAAKVSDLRELDEQLRLLRVGG